MNFSERAPPIKAPPFGRSANCTFPQDCFRWQEDCSFLLQRTGIFRKTSKNDVRECFENQKAVRFQAYLKRDCYLLNYVGESLGNFRFGVAAVTKVIALSSVQSANSSKIFKFV